MHRRYLKQWKRPDDDGRLYAFSYRHSIGQQVLADILAAQP
jgi:hypothetical protein